MRPVVAHATHGVHVHIAHTSSALAWRQPGEGLCQVRAARAEAEAAAEARVAALEEARREEKKDAMRKAIALGVKRVRSHTCCAGLLL